MSQDHENAQKPFSMSYVLRTTAKHMKRDIDLSIRKTFDRVAEFADDPVKSKEVFETLSALHSMRKQLEDFQAANAAIFRG